MPPAVGDHHGQSRAPYAARAKQKITTLLDTCPNRLRRGPSRSCSPMLHASNSRRTCSRVGTSLENRRLGVTWEAGWCRLQGPSPQSQMPSHVPSLRQCNIRPTAIAIDHVAGHCSDAEDRKTRHARRVADRGIVRPRAENRARVVPQPERARQADYSHPPER